MDHVRVDALGLLLSPNPLHRINSLAGLPGMSGPQPPQALKRLPPRNLPLQALDGKPGFMRTLTIADVYSSIDFLREVSRRGYPGLSTACPSDP